MHIPHGGGIRQRMRGASTCFSIRLKSSCGTHFSFIWPQNSSGSSDPKIQLKSTSRMSFTLKALAKNSRPRFHKTAKRKRCGQKADVTPAFNLSGLKRAPFNTTQFIMHDFESRNKCLGIEDSNNPYNVSPSEKETWRIL